MIRNKIFLKQFILVALILVTITTIFIFGSTEVFYTVKTNDIKSRITSFLQIQKESIESSLNDAIVDLTVISESSFFKNKFRSIEQGEKSDELIHDLFKHMFLYKSSYHQFRFLDCKGYERFRVNRVNGEVVLVPAEDLQDKSDRYYFKESVKLRPGQIYISPLDLNIENNSIEVPYRPMIRICKPMFDVDSTMLGVVIINYDASLILNDFHSKEASEMGKTFLINQDGYYLHNPDTTMEWGFMFDDKKDFTFQNSFPGICKQLDTINSEQIEISGSLFTVQTINPIGVLESRDLIKRNSINYHWKIISYLSPKEYSISNFLPFGFLFYPWLIVYLATIIIAWFYSKNAYRKIKAQADLVKSEDELRKSNDDKDLFLSILSHDLKNSLGSMNMYIEFLIDEFHSNNKEKIIASLNSIKNSSANQVLLLEDILLWARVQMGIIEYKPVPISIAELYSEIKQFWELSLNEKNLNIEIETEEALFVKADEGMLKIVFRNLLSNAIKFSFPGSTIKLSAKRIVGCVELSVEDSGVGMDAEQIRKLFDITQKTHREGTKKEGGTGFGLKVIFSLVKKNNGKLNVSSELNKGSVFSVILPDSQ
jgi:signal transduction histidine kinase